LELAVFTILALVAVVSALLVVLQRNPVHSAFYLVVCFFAVAGLYIMLRAEFLAAVQVMVYAGGIMVLFLFVIMLVDLESREEGGREPPRIGRHLGRGPRLVAALVAVAFLAVLAPVMIWAPSPEPSPEAVAMSLQGGAEGGALGNTEWVGRVLYSSYLLPFEVASVLLLVAMIGAVTLARKKS
jgi:NADH-quinone oxidoreductase subunit J